MKEKIIQMIEEADRFNEFELSAIAGGFSPTDECTEVSCQTMTCKGMVCDEVNQSLSCNNFTCEGATCHSDKK